MHYSIYKSLMSTWRKQWKVKCGKKALSTKTPEECETMYMESLEKWYKREGDSLSSDYKMAIRFDLDYYSKEKPEIHFIGSDSLTNNLVESNLDGFDFSLLPFEKIYSISVPNNSGFDPFIMKITAQGLLLLTSSKKGHLIGTHPFDKLNDIDMIKEKQVKLAVSTLLYIYSMPERIFEGLPSSQYKNIPREFKENSKLLKIEPPKSKQSAYGLDKTEHYRKWTFRQLMHPKYYKGAFKNDTIGSRVVFVQDCIVNRVINPKTVLENNA